MDGIKKFIIGIILTATGLLMLLRNVTITSGEDNGIGAMLMQLLNGTDKSSTLVSAAIMCLVIVAVIAVGIKPCFATFSIFAVSVIAVMFNIISGMKLEMADMIASDFVMMFACVAAGLGLALNGAVQMQREKKYFDADEYYEDIY